MKQLSKALLVVGGLNWGLVGIGNLIGSNWNVVNIIVGSWPTLESLVYVLIGVAAVYKLYGWAMKK